MAEMKQRMLRGELYTFDDPELAADFARASLSDTTMRRAARSFSSATAPRVTSSRICETACCAISSAR